MGFFGHADDAPHTVHHTVHIEDDGVSVDGVDGPKRVRFELCMRCTATSIELDVTAQFFSAWQPAFSIVHVVLPVSENAVQPITIKATVVGQAPGMPAVPFTWVCSKGPQV